jgi:hypothetical protein
VCPLRNCCEVERTRCIMRDNMQCGCNNLGQMSKERVNLSACAFPFANKGARSLDRRHLYNVHSKNSCLSFAHTESILGADRCMQFCDLSRTEKSVSSGMCVCLQGDCEIIWCVCVKTGSQGCKINLKAGEPRADFYS